ncbi:hypothetical protein BDN70DRAFT_929060 [Pholiota conissans]|uniref:Uncharacterized protein n=1 Tax=Pholiota conissans TaxID=109636 RepID=A0A9P5ZBB3_9AGAR|nr:hypothetical protein BDN70DRAFT_929060 [Pholiota conissans]
MKIIRSLLILFTSFTVSCQAAASVSAIASDITDVINQAKTLETTYNGLNNYNWMFAGPNLHTGIASISSGMKKVASDITAVSSFPLTEGDSATLFEAAAPLYTLAGQFVQSLLARKAQLTTLPVVGSFSPAVILSELQILQGGANTLTDVMMRSTPPSLAANATSMKTLLDDAMASALKAYST